MHIPRGPSPVSLEYRDDVMYSSFAIFHTERQRATPPQFIIKYRSAGGRARRPECRDELDFTVSHLVLPWVDCRVHSFQNYPQMREPANYLKVTLKCFIVRDEARALSVVRLRSWGAVLCVSIRPSDRGVAPGASARTHRPGRDPPVCSCAFRAPVRGGR